MILELGPRVVLIERKTVLSLDTGVSFDAVAVLFSSAFVVKIPVDIVALGPSEVLANVVLVASGDVVSVIPIKADVNVWILAVCGGAEFSEVKDVVFGKVAVRNPVEVVNVTSRFVSAIVVFVGTFPLFAALDPSKVLKNVVLVENGRVVSALFPVEANVNVRVVAFGRDAEKFSELKDVVFGKVEPELSAERIGNSVEVVSVTFRFVSAIVVPIGTLPLSKH